MSQYLEFLRYTSSSIMCSLGASHFVIIYIAKIYQEAFCDIKMVQIEHISNIFNMITNPIYVVSKTNALFSALVSSTSKK